MSQGFIDNTTEEASFHSHSLDKTDKPLSTLDLDSILKTILQPTNTHHDPYSHPDLAVNHSNASSRRHSVALGELDLHGIDPSWFDQPAYPVDDLAFTAAMANLQQYSQQEQEHHFTPHRRALSMQQQDHFTSFHQHNNKDTQPPLSFTSNNMMMNLDMFHPPPHNDVVTPWLLSTPSTTNDSTCSASPPPLTSEEPKHKRQKTELEPLIKQKDTTLLHPPPPAIMTPDNLLSFVQRYIKDRHGERTIILLTSRVAQKSYGTEKRFLCPPPTTILSGSWRQSPPGLQPRLSIYISGETIQQAGALEWSTPPPPVLPSSYEGGFLHSSSSTIGKCVSKHLHINDADEKRKRVQVMVNIQLSNNENIGTFASKGIKVISKPSKKRQSLKNVDLCIHHGTTISLFNRIRSQTVSTKYLGVSTGTMNNCCFVARTNVWDPFVIWIVDPQRNQQPTTPENTTQYHPPPPAMALHHQGKEPLAVHYNQPIVLQCLTTGLVSPIMTLRKVDKGSLALSGRPGTPSEPLGDPVSQLHKVAFEIQSTLPRNNIYLACLNDVVGRHKCQTPPRQVSKTNESQAFEQDVSDASVWTLVGTDAVRFTFAVPAAQCPDIGPFPVVTSLSQGDATLCLWGDGFTPLLTAYVGDVALATEFKSPEALVCVIPAGGLCKKQPILLVRPDGVIYQTNHTWHS